MGVELLKCKIVKPVYDTPYKRKKINWIEHVIEH